MARDSAVSGSSRIRPLKGASNGQIDSHAPDQLPVQGYRIDIPLPPKPADFNPLRFEQLAHGDLVPSRMPPSATYLAPAPYGRGDLDAQCHHEVQPVAKLRENTLDRLGRGLQRQRLSLALGYGPEPDRRLQVAWPTAMSSRSICSERCSRGSVTMPATSGFAGSTKAGILACTASRQSARFECGGENDRLIKIRRTMLIVPDIRMG